MSFWECKNMMRTWNRDYQESASALHAQALQIPLMKPDAVTKKGERDSNSRQLPTKDKNVDVQSVINAIHLQRNMESSAGLMSAAQQKKQLLTPLVSNLMKQKYQQADEAEGGAFDSIMFTDDEDNVMHPQSVRGRLFFTQHASGQVMDDYFQKNSVDTGNTLSSASNSNANSSSSSSPAITPKTTTSITQSNTSSTSTLPKGSSKFNVSQNRPLKPLFSSTYEPDVSRSFSANLHREVAFNRGIEKMDMNLSASVMPVSMLSNNPNDRNSRATTNTHGAVVGGRFNHHLKHSNKLSSPTATFKAPKERRNPLTSCNLFKWISMLFGFTVSKATLYFHDILYYHHHQALQIPFNDMCAKNTVDYMSWIRTFHDLASPTCICLMYNTEGEPLQVEHPFGYSIEHMINLQEDPQKLSGIRSWPCMFCHPDTDRDKLMAENWPNLLSLIMDPGINEHLDSELEPYFFTDNQQSYFIVRLDSKMHLAVIFDYNTT